MTPDDARELIAWHAVRAGDFIEGSTKSEYHKRTVAALREYAALQERHEQAIKSLRSELEKAEAYSARQFNHMSHRDHADGVVSGLLKACEIMSDAKKLPTKEPSE